ncbi:hypothetical protein HDV01_004326 [Terramyces sp. JEL0728]|nr:hypothetical protein HDV01_004326 [Terramyces sp. JEL0728]
MENLQNLQKETIVQFIDMMNKQSSKLPIKDLTAKLQQIREEVAKEVLKYLLKLDPKMVADGLRYISKELITIQQKSKQKSRVEITGHMLIIQAIATAYPDLFFCTLMGEKSSVATTVFKEFKSEIHDELVGNCLLWICSQQFITLSNGKKIPHPKCVEMWFEYFFPAYKYEKWNNKNATFYARESLRGTCPLPFEPQSAIRDVCERFNTAVLPYLQLAHTKTLPYYESALHWWGQVFKEEDRIKILALCGKVSGFYSSNPIMQFLIKSFKDYVEPYLHMISQKLLKGLELAGYQHTATYASQTFDWDVLLNYLGQVCGDIMLFVHFQAETMVDIVFPQLYKTFLRMLKILASVIRYIIDSASTHLEVVHEIHHRFLSSLHANQYWFFLTHHVYFLKVVEVYTLYFEDYFILVWEFIIKTYHIAVQFGETVLLFMEGEHQPLQTFAKSIIHELAIILEKITRYLK